MIRKFVDTDFPVFIASSSVSTHTPTIGSIDTMYSVRNVESLYSKQAEYGLHTVRARSCVGVCGGVCAQSTWRHWGELSIDMYLNCSENIIQPTKNKTKWKCDSITTVAEWKRRFFEFKTWRKQRDLPTNILESNKIDAVRRRQGWAWGMGIVNVQELQYSCVCVCLCERVSTTINYHAEKRTSDSRRKICHHRHYDYCHTTWGYISWIIIIPILGPQDSMGGKNMSMRVNVIHYV